MWIADSALYVARRFRDDILVLPPKGPRSCNICGFTGIFHPRAGMRPRYDARCPNCKSLERHRLVVLAMEEHGVSPAGLRVLHVAPERSLRHIVSAEAASYTTTDLYADDVDVRGDIEKLPFDDGSFDLVVCNQVLEHVDDTAALSQIFRVLATDGRAILTTPVVEGWDLTYEVATETEAERLLHFAQDDHLRIFGRDIRDRIRSAGFEIAETVADGARSARFGLVWGSRVFIATKRT